MHRFPWIVVVLVLLSSPAVAKTAIVFEDAAVVARVTPGASTAWFSIEHERNAYRLRITDRALILDDEDRDGIVRLPLDRPAPRSVWMVVDLTNGDHAIESQGGHPARRRPLTPAAFRAAAGSRPAQLLQSMTSSVVWIVRPGVGAWVASIEDGSAEDGDGASNGEIAALFTNLTPLGSSPPPPDEVRRDDIVVVIEPLELHVFDVRVVK